jgi:ribonuclease HI
MDIILFTDGSCVNKNNLCKASYGYLILYKLDNNEYTEIEEYSILYCDKTNNRAELFGMISGIEKILTFDNIKSISIYSDSIYTIKSMTEWIYNWKSNGWKTANKKPVKNTDLIQYLDQLYTNLKNKCNNIKIEHVNAHEKEPKKDDYNKWLIWYGNNKVDCNIQKISKL